MVNPTLPAQQAERGLLPCPFCGGKAVCEPEGPHSWGVWCESCDAHGSCVHFDEANARKGWNRRALASGATPPSERAVSVGVLSRMCEDLSGLDKNQPGYHYKAGWNDALRRAMDYAAPPADDQRYWNG